MDLIALIDQGGCEWDEVVDTVCGRLAGCIDARCRDTMVTDANVATRMWFLGMALYLFEARVDDGGDARVAYYLDHIYEYMVFTAFHWGDVHENMLRLRVQMDETYNELGCLCGVVNCGHADLGRGPAAGAGVDCDKDGVAQN
jgi:hypothetical protein